MNMMLINNPDASRAGAYAIARVIYAETGASSLRAVECMAAMIANISHVSDISPFDIVADTSLFGALHKSSPRHDRLYVAADNRAFQMCLRVTDRMLHGGLGDVVRGATKFHHADCIPDWATARGYIYEIDDLLFYT